MKHIIAIASLLLLASCMEDTPVNAAPAPKADATCASAGCSGEMCVDAKLAPEMASTCEWRAEYQCYGDHGTCTRLPSGECGWADTPALRQCLANPPQEHHLPQGPTN